MATQFTKKRDNCFLLGWSNDLPDTVIEAGVQNIPTNRRTSNKAPTNGNTGYKGVHNISNNRETRTDL
jgi:hypothetical protein